MHRYAGGQLETIKITSTESGNSLLLLPVRQVDGTSSDDNNDNSDDEAAKTKKKGDESHDKTDELGETRF